MRKKRKRKKEGGEGTLRTSTPVLASRPGKQKPCTEQVWMKQPPYAPMSKIHTDWPPVPQGGQNSPGHVTEALHDPLTLPTQNGEPSSLLEHRLLVPPEGDLSGGV